jgi:hypothetical protein
MSENYRYSVFDNDWIDAREELPICEVPMLVCGDKDHHFMEVATYSPYWEQWFDKNDDPIENVGFWQDLPSYPYHI